MLSKLRPAVSSEPDYFRPVSRQTNANVFPSRKNEEPAWQGVGACAFKRQTRDPRRKRPSVVVHELRNFSPNLATERTRHSAFLPSIAANLDLCLRLDKVPNSI